MVADIQLLQGKIVQDPESQKPKNFMKLMEELALEILSEEEVAVAAPVQTTETEKSGEA